MIDVHATPSSVVITLTIEGIHAQIKMKPHQAAELKWLIEKALERK